MSRLFDDLCQGLQEAIEYEKGLKDAKVTEYKGAIMLKEDDVKISNDDISMNDLSEEMRQALAFSTEEIAQLEKARQMPINFDDCPETTPEVAIKFKRVNPSRISKRVAY